MKRRLDALWRKYSRFPKAWGVTCLLGVHTETYETFQTSGLTSASSSGFLSTNKVIHNVTDQLVITAVEVIL